MWGVFSLAAKASSITIDVDCTVVRSQGEALPMASESVDCVFFSLALCSVSNQREVLNEAVRVLRPGGVLTFLEHVASESVWTR